MSFHNCYKEKVCPKCGVTHRRRGAYCSRSCGNSQPFSQEHKDAMSLSLSRFLVNTEEGQQKTSNVQESRDIANIKKANPYDEDVYDLTYKNIYLEPVREILSANQFVESGDIWTESD